MGTAIKHPVPDRVKPSSFTKLRAEHQECPDVKNYKWRLNPFRMIYSCTHMTTVGVNGLNPALLNSTQLICYCVARSSHVVWTCETSVSAVLIHRVVLTSTMHSTAEFSRQTTLRFSHWMAWKLLRLLDTASKFPLFLVSCFKDEKLIRNKRIWKLKHANSILESLEYFCQISSKFILIIFSYTVSKLVHFFWDTV